jgi:hypothetical protein
MHLQRNNDIADELANNKNIIKSPLLIFFTGKVVGMISARWISNLL